MRATGTESCLEKSCATKSATIAMRLTSTNTRAERSFYMIVFAIMDNAVTCANPDLGRENVPEGKPRKIAAFANVRISNPRRFTSALQPAERIARGSKSELRNNGIRNYGITYRACILAALDSATNAPRDRARLFPRNPPFNQRLD